MDDDKQALKNRLLEMAKQEAIKFGKDVNREMEKNIKLEKNMTEKWVKIIYVGEKLKREAINKESFEQLLSEFSTDGKPVEYEIIEEKDFLQFQFKDEEIVEKVYNHYNNFFFGNLQQEMVISFLTRYINDLMDEGCATGACGVTPAACSTCNFSEDPDEKAK